MKRLHLKNDSDLLDALLVLKEDAAEKARQEKMAGRLRKRKMNEKDEEDESEPASKEQEKEAGSENEKDKEGKSQEKEAPKKPAANSDDDDRLPGAERLENSVLPPGKSPTSKDIAQRVNFIRAGASLKDPEIQRAIAVWISQLRNPERLAAYTTLDALAQIVLAGKSPAEAPTYVDPAGLTIKGGESSSPPAKEKTATSSTESIPKKSSGPVPITVGEGVVKKLKEVDVPVRSGKLVPFGSKSHIEDLTQRIEDLRRIRSYQERGSDTHHALGAAIMALKKQLNSASKKAVSGNPRIQPVPPLVEKEK